MKTFFRLAAVLFVVITTNVFSQVPRDLAVEIDVIVDSMKPSITLQWIADVRATGYQVSRRLVGTVSWGSAKTVAKEAFGYSDTTVEIGKEYEYRVRKTLVAGATVTAWGYTQSGINVPAKRDRGNLILVVDTTYASDLKNELDRLEKDLYADGYIVYRINVARTDSYDWIKNMIAGLYNAKPSEFKTLFLFGKVPVPYSGFLAPDGHIPDHLGAWPADVYYGEFDIDWTDEVSVTDYQINGVPIDSNSIRKANLNMAGDGKFDITTLDEDVELMIGRVDLSDMTAFGKTEKELLKQYLDKDHNYRVGLLTAPMRGLVDNNFGYMSGEAFASTGWRNMAPLVGKDSLKEIDWFTTLSVEPYLWAYGTGGGNNEGAGGVGSTSDFASKGSKAIFTMLFGSYFGDWNTTNNFLRAPLASEYGLSCAWSGRPYWHFFPMGLGQSLGYCARLTQNNTGSYIVSGLPSSASPNSVHIALMGDPTLKLYPVMPPSNMTTTSSAIENSASLGWDHSTDPNFDGYQIYRSISKRGPFKLLATVSKTTNTYKDMYPLDSINYYFVHAYRLETSPSGVYYNLSPGVWSESLPLKNDVVAQESHNGDKLTALQTPLSSQITLELGNTSDVTITLVDMTGNTISVLTDRVLAQGKYQFELPYTNLSSGVYFIRVIGTQKPLSAKILVVK